MRTVLYNCGPIVTFDSDIPLIGNEMANDKWIISDGKAIIIQDSEIVDIVESTVALDDYGSHKADGISLNAYNLNGRAVIPGLIDSHTHLVWGGDRSNEVRLKQQGKSYAEIAAMGGGIGATVSMTNDSSKEELFNLARQRAQIALKNGTTFIETKSGYGLDVDNELKLLEIAKLLSIDKSLPGIDSTWLGAHSIPKNHTLESYTNELISKQLPKVVESKLARSADVFCEPGWFGIDESEEILLAARKHGLSLRMHIDEFCDGGGGELAAKLNVDTADHAHYTSMETREKMKQSGVNTGFLPGTPYSMGADWPDFNSMNEKEIPWTIATDFNPNNQILSLPFIASILVQRCNVDPLAALAACTINASFTTPHETNERHGVIAKGAVANLNILQSHQWESWCLSPGHSSVGSTVLNGKLLKHEL